MPFLPERNEMKRYRTVDEYILNAQNGKEIRLVLRDLINTTELIETIKWGAPCYTVHKKNVVGLVSFKSYVGLWFYQGALLKDEDKVLINAHEDKTKALRQWRFESVEDLDEKLILKYVNEAIQNEKQNKEIKANRSKQLLIPNELKQALKDDTQLEEYFNAFTKGKQREFAAYISEAKRAETRQSRLQKIIPFIQQNIGLNDKYRK
ncbi:YdeI/OmpD-associated family protein [Draconibacterium sp.]|nr:YdeI/OmpD-associated family protein [Draconibacterium sp.]